MMVLGIESSCDETAAALVEDARDIRSSVIASQSATHSPFGGVVPELASREHVDNICFVVAECLRQGQLGWKDIEAVAVTRGPGLMGALLVGLCYAKALAFALERPLVGVNHLAGHIGSIFLDHPDAETPALSLVVSGGHTSLFLLADPGRYIPIARTRDDAAGEALDKLARHLGLGYPGGPVIDRLSDLGDPRAYSFAIPKISDRSLDFSFSGLKTAGLRTIQELGLAPVSSGSLDQPESLPRPLLDLVASFQAAMIDQLLDRLGRALESRNVRAVHISGGVSCNRELRRRAAACFRERGLPVYFPRPALTTDNAVMIAAAGFQRLQTGAEDGWDLAADPNLKLALPESESLESS